MNQQMKPLKTELSEMTDVIDCVKHSLELVKSESQQNARNLVKLKQLWDNHFNEQPSSAHQEEGLKVDPFDPLHHLLFRRVNDLEKLHPLVSSLQNEVKSLQQQMKHRDEQLAATRQHHPAATPDRDSTVPDKKHQRETGRKKPNKDLDLSEGLRRLRFAIGQMEGRMEEHERKTTRVIVSLHLEQKQCSKTIASFTSEMKQLYEKQQNHKQSHSNNAPPNHTDTIALIKSQMHEEIEREVANQIFMGTLRHDVQQTALMAFGGFNRLFHEVQSLFRATKFIIGTHFKGDKGVLESFQTFFDKCSESKMMDFYPHKKLKDIVDRMEFNKIFDQSLKALIIDSSFERPPKDFPYRIPTQ